MAATGKLTVLLPVTLSSRSSHRTRGFMQNPRRQPPQRLTAAATETSSYNLPSRSSPETPEARQIRLETESALEWGGVCERLAHFAATAAGRAACVGGRVPFGRSREESETLIEQTAAAVLLPTPLDFGGVEDVSALVAAAAAGRALAVRELCAVGRSIRSVKAVFDQLKRLADEMPDGR
jgi:allantoinase/DNA mismatch repair protein MutS2